MFKNNLINKISNNNLIDNIISNNKISNNMDNSFDSNVYEYNENIEDYIIEYDKLNKINMDDIELVDDDEDTSKALKVILIGDSNSGKTSFINKIKNKNIKYPTSTIGVDFENYKLKYKNEIINSNIWDTAGLERYNQLVSSYYRFIDGAILFFDLNNYGSFQSLEYWLNDIIYFIKGGIIYIIGNKNDLERKVKKKDVIKLIKENYNNYNIYYKEISVKNNIPNVKDVYNEYIINLYRKFCNKKIIIDNSTIKLKYNKNKKCCMN